MTINYDSFSAQRAMELCGFKSVAMIDYLQRSGVFTPRRYGEKRRGKGRKFDFRDLVVLKAINKLLESGASVSDLKKSLSEFQKMKWISDPVTLENSEGIIRYLIFSGNSIYLKKNAEVIIDLSKNGQLSFSFIIDLEVIHKELRSSLGLPAPQHELNLPSISKS